ncbi:MAG: STAS domain-containing protein [Parvularculaceae bacterium]|nr:STAS domain-containing protein [Parvularculaceae bacterium]
MTDAIRSICLPPQLDLPAAGPLARELLAARGTEVAIDASKVERFGALCLQVLLSAQKTWTEDGRRLAVIAPSEAFTLGLARFGLPSGAFETSEIQ